METVGAADNATLIPLFVYLGTLALTIWARTKVERSRARFGSLDVSADLAGHEVARLLLDSVGLAKVPVVPSDGRTGDYYDPANRELSLSLGVYNGRSVYALAVAAHEVGHAVQHAMRYPFLVFRTAVIPVARYGPGVGYLLMLCGMVLLTVGNAGGLRLAIVGVALYALALTLTFVSLPIEFNASKQARSLLQANNLMSSDEREGVEFVLQAAALTYVATAASSLNYIVRALRGIR